MGMEDGMVVVDEARAAGRRRHPWFGDHRLPVRASGDAIRQMLRTEIRDIGWPYQDQLPATPMAIPRASYAELYRVTSALVGLLRRTALEAAPTTQARLEAYRMPAREHHLFLSDEFLEERYADAVVRPDIIIGPAGPQFLEFNVSAALGGPVEMHCRLQVWRRLYGDDDGRVPFGYHDPFAVRAALFHDLAAETARAPRVAVVGSTRLPDVERRYFELEAAYYNDHGLTARFFEPEELSEAWDCPPHLRYGLGLRNFTIGDFVKSGVDTAPVQEALDRDCLLVTTQSSVFLHSKLTMAMMSEGRPWMSAAEQRLVDAYLPWTRILTARRTARGGEEVDLVPFVLKHRESLVLKTALGESGNEVILGSRATEAQWESAVAAALEDGTSVVQDFVVPQTCRLPILTDGSDEPEEVDVAPVLGPLLFGGRPAGLFARFFGDGEAGVVAVKGAHRTSSDSAVVAV